MIYLVCFFHGDQFKKKKFMINLHIFNDDSMETTEIKIFELGINLHIFNDDSMETKIYS